MSDSSSVNFKGNSTLQITSQFNVPAGSYIQILYNSAINANDVPSSALNYAALNGVKINGGIYEIKGNIINVTNIFQSNFNVSGNGSIEFTIPQFTNPPTSKPTPYIITLYSNAGYSIATFTYIYTAALQSFTDISLTSSSYKVMNTMVSYSFQFTTYYAYKSVSVLIPP